MTKRKSKFAVTLEEGHTDEGDTAQLQSRRSPMAAAVSENAAALAERSSVEQRVRAENDALAHEHVRLKKLGLIVDLIPLDAVDCDSIERDREKGEDPELEELKTSIREVGLSNPIRVIAGSDDRYQLIQGYRRFLAYRSLDAEHPEQGYDRIPAGLMSPDTSLDDNYRRMVDENLVRKGVSFAEMADLARRYADDPQTSCDAVDDAVTSLFKSAGYQKRTYIRSFARLLDMIGDALTHPSAISRSLGLAVLKRLEELPRGEDELKEALRTATAINEEQETLKAFADGKLVGSGRDGSTRTTTRKASRAKTTFRIKAPDGEVKCMASNRRLELSGGPDFSAYNRAQLEAAVAAFFDELTDT